MAEDPKTQEKKRPKPNTAAWILGGLCALLTLGAALSWLGKDNAEKALETFKEEQRQSQAAKAPVKPATATNMVKPDNLSGVVPDQPPAAAQAAPVPAPTMEELKKLEARMCNLEAKLGEYIPCLDKLCKKAAPVVKKSGKRGPAVAKTVAPNLVPPPWKHCNKPDGPRTARDFEPQEPCANCPKQ